MPLKKKLSVFAGLLLAVSLNTSYIFAQDTHSHETSPTTEQHSVDHATTGGHDEHKGADLAIWSVIPFVIILLCIAILPISPHHIAHWWEQNNNKLIISGVLGGVAFGILTANGWFGKICV